MNRWGQLKSCIDALKRAAVESLEDKRDTYAVGLLKGEIQTLEVIQQTMHLLETRRF